MAFDGITLSFIKNELEKKTLGLRVDKIYCPTKDDIHIVLGGKKEKESIFISASSSSPRIHLTNEKFENPQNPPMFCMLLRKHLIPSRIKAIRQNQVDRILFIDFLTRDSFGDEITLTLSVEIMGRHSNIILIEPNGRVIDSIKRVGLDASSVRQVLPGIEFYLPPAQDKINILIDDFDKLKKRLINKDGELARRLQDEIMGLSPILSRELAYKSVCDVSKIISTLDDEDFNKIEKIISKLKQDIINDTPIPTVYFDEEKKPKDFSIISIEQYENRYEDKSFQSISMAVEFFYKEKYRIEAIKSRSADILQKLDLIKKRIIKRISNQEQEILDSLDGTTYQKYGDLISANMYNIKKGDTIANVVDLYSEKTETISIPLNIFLNAPKNAQKYYKKYKKSVTAFEKLSHLVEKGKQELFYIENIIDTVYRTENEMEIDLIREELIEQGYIKKKYKHQGSKKKIDVYNRYLSSEGIEIISGKNNKANDELTHKTAARDDIWLHVQNIPGSHVVIRKKGMDITEKTVKEAAEIAAFHSKARASLKTSVDYTEIRHVRKQKGGNPGMVFYNDYKTIIVSPSEEKLKKMEVK